MDKAILLDYVRTITGECGQRHGADIYFHSPLHADNTPSFVVHPSNKWHDFAINTSGDVIDLCQRINNCDYKQALFFLSQGKKVTKKFVRLRINYYLCLSKRMLNNKKKNTCYE